MPARDVVDPVREVVEPLGVWPGTPGFGYNGLAALRSTLTSMGLFVEFQATIQEWQMRLQALRVFVDDLVAARRFYGTVLGLPIKWEWEKTAIGFDLDTELIVELVDAGADQEDRQLVGRFTGASITVDNIEAAYTDLKRKGIVFAGSPVRQPWGGILAHFEDSSRNVLTLVQTV